MIQKIIVKRNIAKRLFQPDGFNGFLKTQIRIPYDSTSDSIRLINKRKHYYRRKQLIIYETQMFPIYLQEDGSLLTFARLRDMSVQDVRKMNSLDTELEGYALNSYFQEDWLERQSKRKKKKYKSLVLHFYIEPFMLMSDHPMFEELSLNIERFKEDSDAQFMKIIEFDSGAYYLNLLFGDKKENLAIFDKTFSDDVEPDEEIIGSNAAFSKLIVDKRRRMMASYQQNKTESDNEE